MFLSLAPLRDRRDRVAGYLVSAQPADNRAAHVDAAARELLERVPALCRLAGRTVIVPVTPAMVHEGHIERLVNLDAVWMLAADALEDVETRRDLERLVGAGVHVALHGFPDGAQLSGWMAEIMVALDAARLSPTMLEIRVRMLHDSGLRPLVLGVDDRVTRHRVMQAGAQLYGGRTLIRSAAAGADRTMEQSILHSVEMLAGYAEGRTQEDAFDRFVQEDPVIAASLLRAVSSAAIGVRQARSVDHAVKLLGREAILERLIGVTARMVGEVAADPELAFVALRRAKLVERLGKALATNVHPRALMLTGLLSTLEQALALPPTELVQRMALPPALADALIERQRPVGQLLDLVDALEFGWWDCFLHRCQQLELRPQMVSDLWLEAWHWAREEQAAGRADFL